MALTHTVSVRNAVVDLIVDSVDAGVGTNGSLVLMTSGDVEVATLALSNPAYAAAAAGSAAINTVTNDTDATGGVVALFKIVDTDGTEVFRGTVTATAGGGDIELADTTIPAGSTVSCSALTYNMVQ